MKKLILLLLFFSYTSSSQTWKYSSTNDPFDGKTIYVTAKGYGGEFPYNSPDFYIRYRVKSDNLEMFISGLGYSGCDNNIIRIAYDDNPNKVVEYSVSESVDRDAIFFRSVNFNDILDNLKSIGPSLTLPT